jgi:hypothetical protein
MLLALLLAGAAWLMRALPLPAAERVAAWQAESAGKRVSGTLSPARLGANRVDVVYDTGALIEITFLPVGGDGVMARRVLTEASPGVYGSSGFVISRTGSWQMLIGIERAGQPLAYYTVDWEAGADGGLWRVDESRPWPAQWRAWLNVNGGAALASAVAVVVGAWGWRVWRWVKAHA